MYGVGGIASSVRCASAVPARQGLIVPKVLPCSSSNQGTTSLDDDCAAQARQSNAKQSRVGKKLYCPSLASASAVAQVACTR